jgi:hypothetical protein
MYSVIETAIKLEVSTRTVQKRCKRDNVRKKDNKYLITDEHIEKWRLEIESNEPQTNQTNEPLLEVRKINQLDIEIESLKQKIEELKDELSQYDIADNERIEVFTDEMYAEFEERLIDWKLQNQKIISQQETFDAKEKGLNDVVNLMTEQADHYKNQFQYQKEQATRILDMHEQLIKTIQQNNFLEAKNKGFDKK